MKQFRIIILAMLALHLLAVNTNLLINLTTYFKTDQKLFQISLAILFSFSYSLGTVYTLNRKGFVWLKILFALLDGIAVAIWYNSTLSGEKYVYMVSGFYAVYTVMIALGVGIRDRVKKSNFDSLKYKHIDLYIYGYSQYLKWRFRKSKKDEHLSIANDFELLLNNFELDFDTETVTNLNVIKDEVTKMIKQKE